MNRYEVIPSKQWQHPSGRKVSIYGALPYWGDKGDWQIVQTGWTWRDNRTNTVGLCRVPAKTREEADTLCAEFNARDEAIAASYRAVFA
jgi:hypothetical protein